MEKNTEYKIKKITESLNELLQEKNKRYGNAALIPLGIFNKNNAERGILTRLDDKLMRIKNSKDIRKNDIVDLLGYLVLFCVDKDWTNFKNLID